MAMGGFSVTSSRVALGVKYSYPYVHTGLATLIYFPQPGVDRFAFLKPFSIWLWIAFVLVVFTVPMIAWVIERLSVDGTIPIGARSLHDLRQATYETTLAVYNLQVYQVKSIPAQIVIFSFCFLVLITISTYTSQLSAQFTLQRLTSNIKSIQDLAGKPAATTSAFIPRLTADYGRSFIDIEWNINSYEGEAVPALKNGTIFGYVMSKVLMDPFTTEHNQGGDCSIWYASEIPEEPFDVAIAMHTNMSQIIINAMNTAIVIAQESGQIDALTKKYLTPGVNPCIRNNMDEAAGIGFDQMSGLYIIQAAAVGLSIVYVLVQTWIRVRRAMQEDRSVKDGYTVAAHNESFAGKITRAMSQLVTHEDHMESNGELGRRSSISVKMVPRLPSQTKTTRHICFAEPSAVAPEPMSMEDVV
jgi:ABC-type amino acid transport substrate-binding protein